MAKVSLRAYNQEIETMIDRGHLDEAIAHCRHILKTFPKHLETYRLLGKAYLEYKRYPEAADVFSRVLVASPSDFVANVGMSIIRDEENRLDDAIWHMERAFETQPSNAAIQGELQRLYGRREGVQPPRIRMTRGALAQMYVQGELYPQAISEIKSVLKEDPGRNDMQALLARAYFRSGLKNDAAEVASAVLRANPYNLDANRVLVEILGADRPESVQAYRQRVVELDPYAAQVTGSIFSSNEVPDAAVSLEHLDWNGQPMPVQPDWQTRPAISPEGASQEEEQPDWLKGAFGAEAPAPASQPAPVSPFDMTLPPSRPAGPADEIPDFLRAAGWGQATGAFDESKSAFADREPDSGEPPIEQGELPDWVKAMAPQESAPGPAEEEELPDWINQIGTSAVPVSSEAGDQPDWMKQAGQPASQPEPDWLGRPEEAEQPALHTAAEEPDWLKGFGGETEATPSEASGGELDWLTQLGVEAGSEAATGEPVGTGFDFLSGPAAAAASGEDLSGLFEEPAEATPAGSLSEEFDFLDPLGSQLKSASAAASDEFDFLNELPGTGTPEPASAAPEPAATGRPGMSEEEQDDSFAWLESLAAKQGATEGLLTRPEERREEEPDWIRQVKGPDAVQLPAEEPSVPRPVAGPEDLGKSEQEQDDSFAWLESLAAKQGATEGLLTKPEERREEAPEWVQQARTLGSAVPDMPAEEPPQMEQPPVMEPAADVEKLGKSEQEREDAFAWLEALAARQGASEGLLTQPEERPEEEPAWVQQARDSAEPPVTPPELEPPVEIERDATAIWLRDLEEAQATEASQPQPVAEEPAFLPPAMEPPVATQEAEGEAQLQDLEAEAAVPQALPAEESIAEKDTDAWLESLSPEKAIPEEQMPSADATAIWLKGLGEADRVAPEPEPAQAMQPEELPAWMANLEEEQDQTQIGIPVIREPGAAIPEATEWMAAIEEQPEAATPEVPKVDTGSLPSWLRGLDEEEAGRATFGSREDLPAWLRDETGEPVAEPTRIEPTQAADWQPVGTEDRQPESAAAKPALPEALAPEPVAPEPVAREPQPEPVDVVAIIEEKIAVSEEPARPVEQARPHKEPPARKVTGALTDPVLAQARGELSHNNVSGALENYGRLIKKGRLLEDIIFDLREASYRYPVDVDIWQSLGDAYMRSNRLQDALDAYTKAEELLR